jgi:hypothetical protein
VRDDLRSKLEKSAELVQEEENQDSVAQVAPLPTIRALWITEQPTRVQTEVEMLERGGLASAVVVPVGTSAATLGRGPFEAVVCEPGRSFQLVRELASAPEGIGERPIVYYSAFGGVDEEEAGFARGLGAWVASSFPELETAFRMFARAARPELAPS